MFIMTATSIYSLGHGLHALTAVPRSTQPSIPPSYIRVRAVVWVCGHGHTDRHTNVADHNTFHVDYNSHKM